MSFNSLPLEGKVGGGLRRSDEVSKFHHADFHKIWLALFHLITVLRRSVSLRLGHAPALNVRWTFIHYRRAALLPCNKGRHEKFLLTSEVPKYITYNTPFCR